MHGSDGASAILTKCCPCCTRTLLHGIRTTRLFPTCSLLLATSDILVVLPLARNDLAKHHYAIAVHEGNAREAPTVFECVAHERLLRLKAALRHLVRLQGVGILHLFSAGLFAHLPLERRNPARCPTAPHKADWRVAHLDLVRNVQNLDLGVKLLSLPKRSVFLVHHDIAGPRHVGLVQTLNVQSDIVTRVS